MMKHVISTDVAFLDNTVDVVTLEVQNNVHCDEANHCVRGLTEQWFSF